MSFSESPDIGFLFIDQSCMPNFVKSLWHVQKYSTCFKSWISIIYISWMIAINCVSHTWVITANTRLVNWKKFVSIKIVGKRIKNGSFNQFPRYWQLWNCYIIVYCYLFVIFLMSRAYIGFLPYIREFSKADTIFKADTILQFLD